MKTLTTVWVTTSFIGFHRWPDAPDSHEYLRHNHRHKFNVKLEVAVGHDQRAVEFHKLKTELDVYLKDQFADRSLTHSCEAMARMVFWAFHFYSNYEVVLVSVDEDGENGATIVGEADFEKAEET